MHITVPRAHWSRAFIVAAVAGLGACVDEPVAPDKPSTLDPIASVPAAAGTEVVVTNTSGGTDAGSLRWAANQLVTMGGGTIVFDPGLAGDTITLDAELVLGVPLNIRGPEKGITLSGNNQRRVINAAYSLGVSNVTITKGNGGPGSAIYVASSLSMANSTVQDNQGSSAIFAEEQAWMRFVNSTISRNNVFGAAVKYMNGSTVEVINTTIAYNGSGPGLANGDNVSYKPTRVTFFNAIVAHNGSPAQNCVAKTGFEWLGTNISNDLSCGPMTVADPQLMPLAYNGGPNMTHAIPHTSPAYNTGFQCSVTTDQRYVPRDAKCDVGAFEFNDFTKVTITIDPMVKADAATGQPVLTGTIKCTRPEFFHLALELHQDQKVGKQVVDVHAADDFPLECTPSGSRWSTHMPLAPGEAFQAGAARATATTFQTPDWVTPASVASAVKISFARK